MLKMKNESNVQVDPSGKINQTNKWLQITFQSCRLNFVSVFNVRHNIRLFLNLCNMTICLVLKRCAF